MAPQPPTTSAPPPPAPSITSIEPVTAESTASAPPTSAHITVPTIGPDGTPLSKNQLKKAARRAKQLATRDAWKAQKRVKATLRKERKRAEKRALLESDPTADTSAPAKRQKKQHEVVDTTLILDCGFDELMTENEIVSMASQLTRCYADNRKAERQFKIEVMSFGGRLKQRFEGPLNKTHKHWKGITFSDEPYTPDENTVYLTADSDTTLHELKEGEKYVIGGIVDRNRYKNLCRDKAEKEGIRTGSLPIGDYIKMASRKVLTTNQVVEIMVGWLQHGDWEKAFLEVIPKRKGGVVKKDEEDAAEEEEYEEEEYKEGGEEEQHDDNEAVENDAAQNQDELEHTMIRDVEGIENGNVSKQQEDAEPSSSTTPEVPIAALRTAASTEK